MVCVVGFEGLCGFDDGFIGVDYVVDQEVGVFFDGVDDFVYGDLVGYFWVVMFVDDCEWCVEVV